MLSKMSSNHVTSLNRKITDLEFLLTEKTRELEKAHEEIASLVKFIYVKSKLESKSVEIFKNQSIDGQDTTSNSKL
jgi:hypothetical protein